MARPLKANTTPNPITLNEISDAELAYCADLILDEFVSSNTGTGCLFVNPGVTTGLTLIGSWTDTERPYNIGDHPVGTDVVSVTYNFYQDQRTISHSPTRPIEFSSGNLREQSDAEITAYIANTAVSTLISSGQGTYRIGTSAPTPGTWITISTMKDEITGSSNTAYNLYRRTDGASGSTIRPLKANTSAPFSLREMSDAEIQSLNTYFRNRIVSSGVGTYSLATSTPGGGTWVNMGTLNDTRQQIASQNYGGTFTGFYTGTFTGFYLGTYSQNFIGNYGGINPFTGAPTGINYQGSYTGFFSGSYAGNYQTNFSGDYGGVFAGNTILSNTETIDTKTLWLRTA